VGDAAEGAADDAEADDQVRSFRQGDVITFRRVVVLDIPTEDGKVAALQQLEPEATVVVTQTCDLVRSIAERPTIQVAPLIRIKDEQRAAPYREGASPRYVWLPRLGPDAFIDLDVVSTISKRLLVSHDRNPGVGGDDEARRFRLAIARKFGRPALPDDVAPATKRLRARIGQKWDKPGSAEGSLMQSLLQVRLAATPSWDADNIHVDLVYIVEAGLLPPLGDEPLQPSPGLVAWFGEGRTSTEVAERIVKVTDDADLLWLWARLGEAWTDLCEAAGVVGSFGSEVVGADEFTVDRYWASAELDIDYLSGPGA